MRCPFCPAEETQVKDSRPTEDNAAIRRRRFCTSCDARFTTFERVQLREMTVIKKDGEKEVFDRDKLQRSMKVALRKRPIEDEVIEKVTNIIVRELEALGEGEISTTTIGEHALSNLRKLDTVAYIRYVSVYKDFNSTSDFVDFVDTLKN
ncbi:MAG: transcriptional regulator NrdR [Alphaproteobacteria bacterium]|nr:transcriptional regulator NrdR [Alphaproteobacteria bacterium]MCL2505899.1 transcriptional regulator NrdR [Alphaproteobacteria bacterium]